MRVQETLEDLAMSDDDDELQPPGAFPHVNFRDLSPSPIPLPPAVTLR
jgi:hypothetical protein